MSIFKFNGRLLQFLNREIYNEIYKGILLFKFYMKTDMFQMSDAASQTMVEYALADIIYHVENEGKLPEF